MINSVKITMAMVGLSMDILVIFMDGSKCLIRNFYLLTIRQ